MKKLHLLRNTLALGVGLCLALAAGSAQAAISFNGDSVGPLTFDTQPGVADGWSTLSVAGATGDYADAAALDAAVIANTDASAVTTALGSSATTPPSQNAVARWNSNLHLLQTRPTGNAYIILMATLQNGTGGNLPTLRITYDWDQKNAIPVNESVAGHRVFYSTTGTPGSWVAFPDQPVFDNNSAAQTVTLNLAFSTPWAPDEMLYIIWVDDNGPGGTTDPQEGAYTIDNFFVEIPFVRPIEITQQPVGTNVFTFRPFSLGVQVTGTQPQYQWYLNDGPITGANSATYSVAQASLADAGEYFVRVSNESNSVDSAKVQVVVNEDLINPGVVSIRGSASGTEVTILFSEKMNTVGEFNWEFTLEPPGLGISSVRWTNDSKVVVLTTDAAATPNTPYTLTIANTPGSALVTDLAGNVVSNNVQTFQSWVPSPFGGVVFQVYSGLSTTDNNIALVTNSAKFPSFPDETYRMMTNFNTRDAYPDDVHEGYGGRLRGLFIPPVNGKFRLFLLSDDSSLLFFNPAGPDPAGKVQVAYEAGCCGTFKEPGTNFTQTSEPFDLIAGQAYYVEAVYKEGNGGDYCYVSARLEGDPLPAASLYPIGGSDAAFQAIPPGLVGAPIIDTPPANVIVERPGSATFAVAAHSDPAGPFVYQWQKSDDGGATFVDIPSASEPIYRLAVTTQADDQDQYRVVVIGPGGEATSAPATLTVTPDVTGPKIVSAMRLEDNVTVVVTFSEPLLSVGDQWSYVIAEAFNETGVLTIANSTPTTDNMGIILTLEAAPANLSTVYRLTAQMPDAALADLDSNPLQQPWSVVIRMTASFQQGDANGYTGAVDTHIRSDNATTAYGANPSLLVDNLSPLSQGLVRFDNLFGAGSGQISLGSEILSAELSLFTDNWGNDIQIRRMLVPWDNNSTWNTVGSANDGVSVTAGDAENAIEAVLAPIAVGVRTNVSVVNSVRVWSTNGAPNYGWVLIDSGDDGYQFGASDTNDITYRPKLTVTYLPSGDTNPIVILTQPAPTNHIFERQGVTLSVVAIGTLPTYQWYKDGSAIDGATLASYNIPSAVPLDSGRYYCVIGGLAGPATSADSWLTVVPDTTRPTVLAIEGGLSNSTTIVVTFSKPLNQASAETAANYTLTGPGGLTVVGAVLANGTNVTLTLSGTREPGQDYALEIKDVIDTAVTPNVVDPNPTTQPVAALVDLIAIETSPWKYLQQTASGQPAPCLDGESWMFPGYDDNAWQTGFGVFYGARGEPQPVSTPATVDGSLVSTFVNVFTNGGNALQEYVYYFRTTFNYVGNTDKTTLLVHSMVDDGAVFYLNGNRIYELRVTNNPASCTNFTAGGVTGGQTWAPALANPGTAIPLTGLMNGENTLAVSLHQNNGTSSDITFGLLLQAHILSFVPSPVIVPVYNTANGQLTLRWTGAGVLESAPDVTGPWTPVQNPTNPYTVTVAPTDTRLFYRLASPQ